MLAMNVYAADKAAAFPDRLLTLREGKIPYPVHLHLIVSDLCNLDCPGCAYRMSGYTSNQMFSGPNGERNPNRMLSKETVYRVLSDCAEMGTKAVEFTGGGEPTVHPHLYDFIAFAHDLGLDTALITNGIKLQPLIPLVVDSKWVRISIDAASASTYAKVRPSFGNASEQNFDRALANLSRLRNHRDRLKTDCVIGAGFVVQKENWREIADAVRLFRDAGADNVRISGLFSPEGEAYHAEYREEALALEKAAVDMYDHLGGFRVFGRFSEKVSDLHAPPDYPDCHYQKFTTYVGGDGNVYRCCVTSYNRQGFLGSLDTHGGSLKKLWDDEVVRARLQHFDARTCVRCQFNDRNRAIDAMLKAPALPVVSEPPPHASFV
jgi:sulfatase maturation enzyme AslB (radical SAM superfamily)